MTFKDQDIQALKAEEARIQRLRLIVDRTACSILHGRCSVQQVEDLIGQARDEVLELFPDKGELFDLIYRPRFTRLFQDWGQVDGC